MGTHRGTCFCGDVEIEVTGEPVAMGYCHCGSCRAWAAAPLNAFTLWKPAAVRVTRGKEGIGEFHKSAQSHRMFCTHCGGHLMTTHPTWEVVDVYAATIPTLAFVPTLHLNYGENVVVLRDGLPKFRDAPKTMGGSDETIAD